MKGYFKWYDIVACLAWSFGFPLVTGETNPVVSFCRGGFWGYLCLVCSPSQME